MRDDELTTISSREVGARIRKLREERGLTAGDLAGKVGVAEDQLRSWESGVGVAPYEVIKALAAALATTVDAFVS